MHIMENKIEWANNTTIDLQVEWKITENNV